MRGRGKGRREELESLREERRQSRGRRLGRVAGAGRRLGLAALVFLAAASLLAGCSEILIDDQMVEVDGTGLVRGTVFIDQNGNRENDEADEPLPDVRVRILQPLGGAEIQSAVTDEAGTFVLDAVPVGTYRADVDRSTLPDSLDIIAGDERFVLSADATITVRLQASFSSYDLAEVVALEPGVRVFTTGIALNPRDPEGDAAVHLSDGSAYLRATNVENVPVTVGDSVRLSGRTALEAGLPVLDDVQVFFLREGAVNPVPLDRATSAAANADGGELNAALVRIRDAEILDTVTVDGDLVATIDDGSGPVDLVLRSYLDFDTDAFAPEFSRVDEATGLLVGQLQGDGGVEWRILPRFPRDVQVEEFPLLTVQEIRQLPRDQEVTAEGIAVNPVDAPIPGTVHIRDLGIHIRVRQLGTTGVSPLPGDTVRIRGRTDRESTFPVLDALQAEILSASGPPPSPAVVQNTAEAATARNGQLADGLVRVEGATVSATRTENGVFVATVSDGSGPVDVEIHDTVGFDTSALTAGASLDFVVGVLVPELDPVDGTVSWSILPRTPSDIQVAP